MITNMETGHMEYSWSSVLREKIIQFTYQIVRSDSKTIHSLSIKLNEILSSILLQKEANILTEGVYQDLLITLYKIIGKSVSEAITL